MNETTADQAKQHAEQRAWVKNNEALVRVDNRYGRHFRGEPDAKHLAWQCRYYAEGFEAAAVPWDKMIALEESED